MGSLFLNWFTCKIIFLLSFPLISRVIQYRITNRLRTSNFRHYGNLPFYLQAKMQGVQALCSFPFQAETEYDSISTRAAIVQFKILIGLKVSLPGTRRNIINGIFRN